MKQDRLNPGLLDVDYEDIRRFLEAGQ